MAARPRELGEPLGIGARRLVHRAAQSLARVRDLSDVQLAHMGTHGVASAGDIHATGMKGVEWA